MRYPVLYNPYCQEGRFVFPLPGHWAICIFGKPLGSNKELSKEIMDFDLDKCCFEVMLFCSCDQFKHYWIKWTANQPQRNFLGVLGNYVLYNSQKNFVPIAQLYLLLLSLSGALWLIGGFVGWRLRLYLLRHSPNCHRPSWKSNFGKITMMRKNRSGR